MRPQLEVLEDRTLLSGSPENPLPIVSVASPPAVPSVAAVTSYVADTMNQWGHLIATVEQDVLNLWKAIGQEIAREVAFVEQQWDRLLGINPNPQNSSSGSAVPQSGSGSGSGSGSMTTANNSPNQSPNNATKPSGVGSGSGSGSSGTHATPELDPGSGSGSGNGGSGPYVYLSSSSYSANEGGTANVEVDLSAASSSVVSVQVQTLNGTAYPGIDYLAVNTDISFQPNITSIDVPIQTIDDGPRDDRVKDQIFGVMLSNVTGPASLGTPSFAAVNISEGGSPPPPPTVGFLSSTYSAAEGNTATITATLSAPSNNPVTVQYATSDGTAGSSSGDDDYNPTNGTLTFAPGATSASFSVQTNEDNDQSANPETVNLTLSNPSGADPGLMSATLNISEPTPPTVGFSNASYGVTEGQTATITATLSAPSSQTVTVQYATSDGTASSSSPDLDYNSASGTLTFNPGIVSQSFTVQTIEDNDASASSESVNLTLSNPVGATAGLTNAALNIYEPSPPPPPPPPPTVGFSSASYGVTEGQTATITATLSSASTQTVTVQYATSDGTASSSSPDFDYTSTSGTLTFNPGVTSQTFSVQTIEDHDNSASSESVNLTLSNPSGATAGLMSSALGISEPSSPPPPPPPPPPAHSVSGIVWQDSNEDGLLDSGETGLAGISVTLNITYFTGTQEDTITTTTDANGDYTIGVPSTYDTSSYIGQVFVYIPAADEATIENASGSGNNSNINGLGFSNWFNLGANATVNAGLVTSSSPSVLIGDPSNLCADG